MRRFPGTYVLTLADQRGNVLDARRYCLFCGGPKHETVEFFGVKIAGCPAVPNGMLIPIYEERKR